jgi:hypothetical protein
MDRDCPVAAGAYQTATWMIQHFKKRLNLGDDYYRWARNSKFRTFWRYNCRPGIALTEAHTRRFCDSLEMSAILSLLPPFQARTRER